MRKGVGLQIGLEAKLRLNANVASRGSGASQPNRPSNEQTWTAGPCWSHTGLPEQTLLNFVGT